MQYLTAALILTVTGVAMLLTSTHTLLALHPGVIWLDNASEADYAILDCMGAGLIGLLIGCAAIITRKD